MQSSSKSRKKREEKFTLLSDHDGSLLRRQPGASKSRKQAAYAAVVPSNAYETVTISIVTAVGSMTH